MKLNPFFSKSDLALEIEVQKNLLSVNGLEIIFQIQGADISKLKVPQKNDSGKRIFQLWEHTCFEFFIASDKKNQIYWEYNFSPNGDWNCFGFSGYRSGMKEEEMNFVPKIEWKSSAQQMELKVICDISFVPQPARMGICAVIENREGEKQYWATKHTKDQPDFHAPESFVVLL